MVILFIGVIVVVEAEGVLLEGAIKRRRTI